MAVQRRNMEKKMEHLMENATPFEQTPEAQEYIGKLQSERASLAEGVSALEHEALSQLRQLGKRVRALNANKLDLERQIEQGKAQAAQIQRESDGVTGQLSAYAQLLVSAEGKRRDGRNAVENIVDGNSKSAGPLTPEAKAAEATTPDPTPITSKGKGKGEQQATA